MVWTQTLIKSELPAEVLRAGSGLRGPQRSRAAALGSVAGVAGGKRDLDEPLAGKSTLNRLELTGRSRRYHKISYSAEAMDRLLADLYLESHAAPPDQIVLDLDATDIPLHGHQPERFFHGYYDSYCYLPLYIFSGDQLLCARLRPANQDAAAGSVEEVSRIVEQLRAALAGSADRAAGRLRLLPRRADGLVRNRTMSIIVFGLARNKRLRKIIGAQMHQAGYSTRAAARRPASSPSSAIRPARAGRARAAWWPRPSISTRARTRASSSLRLTAEQWAAQDLYEKFYCARGEMENRIKEQMCLFADRLSTDEMKGNQLRLYFSALAYTLMEALRRLGLKGTEWAEAQVDTIRLKLLKIGAIVRLSVRRVLLQLSSAYPWKDIYAHAFHALRC